MKKLCRICLLLLSLLLGAASALAAVPNVSREYVDKYFTTVAAASCLGVYLPDSSTEFSYLRSYGWELAPQTYSEDKVETNFVIARNYFPELQKRVFLVTFRGSASKKDWGVNLQTQKVNFGGADLASMEALAAKPLREKAPAVHEGFNSYVNAVMRSSVLDEAGKLKGVFKAAAEDGDAYLVLSGHSLGGAAATLLGERLVSLGLPKEKFIVVTFGAPAVGNEEFVQEYGEAVNLLRITNTADPVPGSLQTFFGGYKQFGKHIKYRLSPKLSSMQHDMAMYFDYSVSELYKAFDKEVEQGHLYPVPDTKVTEGEPVVALWINEAARLHKVATVVDLKRFLTDEYKRMLPSYVVMDKALGQEAYAEQDIVQLSRYAGADYILICGIDGSRQRNDSGWYLTLEQALFDKQGRMLSMSSLGRKVAPGVGNIQAAGENLVEAGRELHKQLPFVLLQREAHLSQE